MYKTLKEYKKKKKYLIAIDSDGCVFDNMTIKHMKFFFPILLETFEIENDSMDLSRLWERINLEYPTRGINRFLALYKFFQEVKPKGETATFDNWIKTGPIHSNEALTELYSQTNDTFIHKVLKWSYTVNDRIKKELTDVKIFEGAKIAIRNSSEIADVVVVSSANQDAIEREWKEAGLLSYIQFVASQDLGSKASCLKKLIMCGYEPEHVLMIGDAQGDYEAAKAVGAYYYQIQYKNEIDCWKKFEQEHRNEFTNKIKSFKIIL